MIDYMNYLWYGIISVLGFLFILIIILIIELLKKREIAPEIMEQYVPIKCQNCGQILEADWNRCPFCMDIIEKPKIYAKQTAVPHDLPIGYLIVKTGIDRGKIYRIDNNVITIGSGNQNDIIIDDAKISPQHLKIWSSNRKFYIQDLQSQLGTRVNNRVIDKIELYDNDLIEVANNLFLFKVLD